MREKRSLKAKRQTGSTARALDIVAFRKEIRKSLTKAVKSGDKSKKYSDQVAKHLIDSHLYIDIFEPVGICQR